jgi:hypothetical protein
MYPRATHKTVIHHAGTKVKVKAKHATGPVVHHCNSGNTVKYHASPDCRSLAHCGVSVVPMALPSA